MRRCGATRVAQVRFLDAHRRAVALSLRKLPPHCRLRRRPSHPPMNLRAALRTLLFSRLPLAALFALSCASAPLQARDTEVVVVADRTAEGKDFQPPTPENPVFYILASAGAKELGTLFANEKIPPASEVEPAVRAALTKQGYQPATKRHPDASLLIVYSWGSINPTEYGMSDEGLPALNTMRGQLLGLLGGEKVDLSPRSPERAYFFTEAEAGRYFLLVGAYDYAAFQKGEKKMLWRARVSMPTRGTNLPAALPVLLAAGSPFFGQDEPKPLAVPTNLRGTDIQIGQPVVKEFIAPAK
jgi:hypothetical protein